jgi:NADPH:quinone reductase-like Zn-dependent oxidoreductase
MCCFAQELGADQAIDYTQQRLEEVLKGSPVDAVIDMLGGALAQHAWLQRTHSCGTCPQSPVNIHCRGR